ALGIFYFDGRDGIGIIRIGRMRLELKLCCFGIGNKQPASLYEVGNKRNRERALGVILATKVATAAANAIERVAGDRDGFAQVRVEAIKVDVLLAQPLKSFAQRVRADSDNAVFQRVHMQEWAENVILVEQVVIIQLDAEVPP